MNRSENYTFYTITNQINYYSCLILALIGLFFNIFTIFIIKIKSNLPKSNQSKVNFQFHPGYSTSKKYMLAMAFSDSFFLISHLLENSFPLLSSHPIFQIINTYDTLCKLVLFIRNGSRMCSSYLVVLFAYERYIVIKQPLIRLKIHKKKLTRHFILGVYFLSYILTSYTPFISGLVENDIKDINDFYGKYECDTKQEFKSSYGYIAFIYINTGIIIPIILLSYLNIYIIYVLTTRKNEIFRQTFSVTSKLNNPSNQLQTSFIKKNNIKKLSNSCNSLNLNQNNNNSKTIKIKLKSKSEIFKINQISIENLNGIQKCNSFEEDGIKLNNFSLKKIVKENSNSLQQLATISKSFKESDRATLILILLSVIFILLNFPYICSW
jgi:hypothetical protein